MNPETEELASLYVLDRLDGRERAAFEALLLRDPGLSAYVGELESAFARHVRSVPQINPPASLLEGIDSRIDGLAAAGMREHARSPWIPMARWGIAAILTVSVGMIAIQQLRRGRVAPDRPYVIIVGMDSRQSTQEELPLQARAQDPDGRFMQLASLAEQLWEKPEGLPKRLRSTGPTGHGYALFDPASSQGFIAIQQLPAVERDKRYHLWILDTSSGQVREAGILPLDASSSGLYFFSVAPIVSTSNSLDFFVTVEDSGAPKSAHPTGKVVLGEGKIF